MAVKTMFIEEAIKEASPDVARIAKKELLMFLDKHTKLEQALERIIIAQYDDTPLSNLNGMIREAKEVLINFK